MQYYINFKEYINVNQAINRVNSFSEQNIYDFVKLPHKFSFKARYL